MVAPNNKITPAQIKKIHALKRALGWDEDLYREILDDRYGVNTSTRLSAQKAADFIRTFQAKAVELGVWQVRKIKHQGLKRKDTGYATPRQARLVEALWSQVTRQETEEDSKKALRHFIKRIIGVDDMRFVEKKDVEKLVRALEKMGAKYER